LIFAGNALPTPPARPGGGGILVFAFGDLRRAKKAASLRDIAPKQAAFLSFVKIL
jgi:hypothetical protein